MRKLDEEEALQNFPIINFFLPTVLLLTPGT